MDYFTKKKNYLQDMKQIVYDIQYFKPMFVLSSAYVVGQEEHLIEEYFNVKLS